MIKINYYFIIHTKKDKTTTIKTITKKNNPTFDP